MYMHLYPQLYGYFWYPLSPLLSAQVFFIPDNKNISDIYLTPFLNKQMYAFCITVCRYIFEIFVHSLLASTCLCNVQGYLWFFYLQLLPSRKKLTLEMLHFWPNLFWYMRFHNLSLWSKNMVSLVVLNIKHQYPKF